MAKRNNPSQRDVDAALSGVAAPRGLEALTEWAEEMRAFAAEPDAKLAAAHIASTADIAASAPSQATPAETFAKASPLLRFRRRLVMSSLLSGVVAKVFAASVALATVTGGVAATGALPDAVQDPLAGIYNSVGFDFPTSGDCASAEDCSDSDDLDQETPTSDPEGGDPSTGPNNTNGNKKGPDNTEGNKNGPGDNNPNDPGENNGNGPGNNNGNGPGENNGNGPGNNNGNGPGENNGEGSGSNNGNGPGNNSRQDGGDEG